MNGTVKNLIKIDLSLNQDEIYNTKDIDTEDLMMNLRNKKETHPNKDIEVSFGNLKSTHKKDYIIMVSVKDKIIVS